MKHEEYCTPKAKNNFKTVYEPDSAELKCPPPSPANGIKPEISNEGNSNTWGKIIHPLKIAMENLNENIAANISPTSHLPHCLSEIEYCVNSKLTPYTSEGKESMNEFSPKSVVIKTLHSISKPIPSPTYKTFNNKEETNNPPLLDINETNSSRIINCTYPVLKTLNDVSPTLTTINNLSPIMTSKKIFESPHFYESGNFKVNQANIVDNFSENTRNLGQPTITLHSNDSLNTLDGWQKAASSGTKSPVNSPSADFRSFVSCGPICRICHDDNEKESFISPCRCLGTMALVHKKCLERWLSVSNEEKCELCSCVFPIQKRPKSFLKFVCENEDLYERRAIISDFTCLCILTPLILTAVYLCVVGAIHFQSDENTTKKYYYIPRRHLFGEPFLIGNFTSFGNGSENSYLSINSSVYQTRRNSSSDWKSAEFSGLIVLAAILLLIYVAWLVIAVKYHVRAWKVWRLTHQEVVLVVNK